MKESKKNRRNHFRVLLVVLAVTAGQIGAFFFGSDVLYAAGAETGNSPVEIAESEIYAQSAVLMDAASGRVLYNKAGEKFRPNASTTKILTCIVALENADLDELVTVSEYAASMPDVQLNVNVGEHYRLEDLLYSLMLESHNDSAVAIAEHVGKTVENFASMMNSKAEEIGCTNSFFVTPNGLDKAAAYTAEDGTTQERNHGTTAVDLAKIMSYCVLRSPKKDIFLKITRTSSYSFSNKEPAEGGTGQAADGGRHFSCTNHNAYLSMDAEALSGKTGFTSAAGYCYVGSVQSRGRTFVVALLACGWPNNKNYKWKDCRRLFSYAKDCYHYHSLDALGIEFEQVEIARAANKTYDLKEKTYCQPTADLSMEILLADWEKLDVKIQYPRKIAAPLTTEKTIGTVEIFIGETFYAAQNIKVSANVRARDLPWYVTALFHKWQMLGNTE